MTWGPTPAGWALLWGAPTCALAGWVLPRPELLAAALVAGLALLCTAVVVAVAPPARAEREEVGELRVGRMVTLRARVWGGTGPRTWFLLTDLLDAIGDARLTLRVHHRQPVYQVTPDRRGATGLGPLRVRHTDILGLWHRTRCVVPAEQVLVFPRLVTVPAPGRLPGAGGGGGSRPGGGGGQVGGVRPYQDGDERRSVHWLSSARTGSLMVRQYAGGSAGLLDLWLVTSATEYPAPEDFEHAVALTAAIVQACLAEPLPCRLSTTGGLRLTGDGPGDRRRLLDTVAQLRLDGSDPAPQGRAEQGRPLVIVRAAAQPGGAHTLTLPVGAAAGGPTRAAATWRAWCLDRWRE